MRHVVIDLETWGLERGYALRSIAAVPFDPRSGAEIPHRPLNAFYRNFDCEEQMGLGLKVDPGTKNWWNDPMQAEAAQFLEKDQQSAYTVLLYFERWLRETFCPDEDWSANLKSLISDVRFWSRGNMDWEVLNGLYQVTGRDFPFHYRAHRDSRVMMDLADEKGGFVVPEFEGVPHYALDDAVYEGRLVSAVYAHLGLGDTSPAPDEVSEQVGAP